MADVGESVIFISYFLLQHFDVNENLLSVSLENVRIYTMKQHRTKQKPSKFHVHLNIALTVLFLVTNALIAPVSVFVYPLTSNVC